MILITKISKKIAHHYSCTLSSFNHFRTSRISIKSWKCQTFHLCSNIYHVELLPLWDHFRRKSVKLFAWAVSSLLKFVVLSIKRAYNAFHHSKLDMLDIPFMQLHISRSVAATLRAILGNILYFDLQYFLVFTSQLIFAVLSFKRLNDHTTRFTINKLSTLGSNARFLVSACIDCYKSMTGFNLLIRG